MADTPDSNLGILEKVSKYRPQIMGFAAMWIFIFHVRNEVLLFFHVPVLNRIEIFFDNIGFCGVDIFLFLSGWGLYHAINKHSLVNFYGRRYRRLIPPFIITCVFKALVWNWDLLRFVKAFTGWSFFTKYIHEPLWFIPAIAILYLFFPLYRRLFDKASCKYVYTGAAILLWFALAFAVSLVTKRIDGYIFVNRIPVFLIGILFGWLTFNGKKSLGKAGAVILVIMLLGGFQLQYYCTFRRLELLIPVSSNAFPALLIGISVCFVSALVFHLLRNVTVIQKVFGFLGKMSLEFYVAQECLEGLLRDRILNTGVPFNKPLYALIVLLVSLGGGYLLYILTTIISNKLDGKPVFTAKASK